MDMERYGLNKQLAQMLKGGVIMDVTTPKQAEIAEKDSRGYPCGRRCIENERSEDDQRDSGGSDNPGYGEMQDWTFCGGTDFRGHRD